LAIAIPAMAVKPKIMYVSNMIHFLNVVGSTTRWTQFTPPCEITQMHSIYTKYDYLV
jgi:hypothetical protein